MATRSSILRWLCLFQVIPTKALWLRPSVTYLTSHQRLSFSAPSAALRLTPSYQLASNQTDAHSLSKLEHFNVDLIKRSVFVALSCVTTWLLTKHLHFSPIQASAVHGVISSLAFSPYATASFCGSFAGMSSQVLRLSDAFLLGAICSFIYYIWECAKIQPGKGGRLGTIAWLSNVAFNVPSLATTSSLLEDVKMLSPVFLLLALPNGFAWVVKKGYFPRVAGVFQIIAFGAITSVMWYRLGASLLSNVWTTGAIVGVAALIVRKSPGTVLPTSLTGLIGSFTGRFAAPVYMGSFIGMTNRENFSSWNLFKSCTIAALLYHLEPFKGMGGRLGLLAFLGVTLGGI